MLESEHPLTVRRERDVQTRLPFAKELVRPDQLSVLDLFAGLGGLSQGFAGAGFSVRGVDHEKVSQQAFELNRIGAHTLADLRTEDVHVECTVLVGGPPCRPWSSVNLQRRGQFHQDHALLGRFFHHLAALEPRCFLMENVPPLLGDPEYVRLRREMGFQGYSIESEILRYSDFGAASSRRRLFTFGIRDAGPWSAPDFFESLRSEQRSPGTVREAIEWLANMQRGAVPDHEWSRLKSIGNYRGRYESGQYGWRQLEWDEPAPSFGSIAKTYILHPEGDPITGEPRVLSVREVLSIMGFPRDFRFPEGTSLTLRYRMAANAVSPIVSAACARTLWALLVEGRIRT